MDGFCESDCLSDCEGKECGDDGCGGSCGECEAGFTCEPDGTCFEAPNIEDVVSEPDVVGATDIDIVDTVPAAENLATEADVSTEEPKQSDDGCRTGPAGAPAAGWMLLALLLGMVVVRRYSPDSRP